MRAQMRSLLTVAAVAGLGLTACTQTMIVFKPSPYIDPLPRSESRTFEDKTDPKLAEQWNLKAVGVGQDQLASGVLRGNYNVKVAILSTGLAYNDDEFYGQVAINRANLVQNGAGDRWEPIAKDKAKNGLNDVVGYDVVDGDSFAYDRHGAGTAIAGIIGARQNNGIGIAGLMKEVSLYPIRYINDNGQTSLDKLVKALEVALQVKPSVVFIQNTQFRLGGRRAKQEVMRVELELLSERLKALKSAKIPVVIGSGDDMAEFGAGKLDSVFRSFDNVVVVTATDHQDSLSFLANFSFGNVHTAAPGEQVITTKPGNQFTTMSGTAVAAAHVTAALALARAAVGERVTYEKIIPLLLAADASDLVPKLDRFSRGGNRLNIPKFLAAVQAL